MTLTATIIFSIIVSITFCWSKRKPTSTKEVGFNFAPSQHAFTVYQSPKVNPNNITVLLQGNKIDELGYLIYKSHVADLDKIDILIRDNQTGEVMKIVKDGESESMIGVSHPENGHLGYLGFETVT